MGRYFEKHFLTHPSRLSPDSVVRETYYLLSESGGCEGARGGEGTGGGGKKKKQQKEEEEEEGGGGGRNNHPQVSSSLWTAITKIPQPGLFK